jgi:hypothetical protein
MKKMSTQHSILTLGTLSMALFSACGSTTSPVKPPPRVETLTGQINNKYTPTTITVLGKTPVVTDANGRFSIPDVSIPYTVKVVVPDYYPSQGKYTYVFENVSTNNLNAIVNSLRSRGLPDNNPAAKSLIIKGSIRNSSAIPGQNQFAIFLTTNLDTYPFPRQSDFEFQCYECAMPKAKATASVFYVSDLSGSLNKRFTGFGKRSITVPADGTVIAQDIEPQPINTRSITVKAVTPDGKIPTSSVLQHFIQLEPGEAGIYLSLGTVPLETTFNAPDIAGSSHFLIFSSSYQSTNQFLVGAVKIDNNTNSLSIDMPKFISLTSPANGSLVDTRKPNLWKWSENSGLFVVKINRYSSTIPSVGSEGSIFTLYTSKNQINLEDYDVNLSVNAEYKVSVSSFGIVSAIDDTFASFGESQAFLFQTSSWKSSGATATFKTLP